MNTQTQNEIAFKRIKSDLNGNPRYVCHFLNFQGENEKISYDTGLARSRELGGSKFNNKQYGGGIVFQMYEGEIPEMTKRINEIAQANNLQPVSKETELSVAVGHEVAELLTLKFGKDGRTKTSCGTKSIQGLGACITRIVEEQTERLK